MTNTFSTIFSSRHLKVLSLAVFAMVGSFSLGIQSAGDVRPVSLIEAGSNAQQSGDVDGNGVVDNRDAMLILEISQGYVTPTAEQLQADPNGDGRLTVDDAIRILAEL